MGCYHVELRSFPHVARAFNLDRETLDRRFLRPFAAGESIAFDDRRWAADRTKLTVFEGAAIDEAARGLGRGWGEVTRHGREVTGALLAEARDGADARPELEALKRAIADVSARPEGIALSDAVALAVAGQPGRRASEQLSLAERAVWELLHQRRVELLAQDGEPMAPVGWRPAVLSWAQWTAAAEEPVRLRATGPGED